MAEFFKLKTSESEAVRYDEGLRSYMLSIFKYMAIALYITGLTAYFAGTSEAFLKILYVQNSHGGFSPSMVTWIMMFAPLGFAFFVFPRLGSMESSTAQIVFWAFAVVMGLSMSSIFLTYTSESIARTFFICASTFGVACIYGYTTKKDLTNFGSFLFMGLIGIILASLVNFFFHSSAMEFAISVAGVLIFTGLTIYDTQKLKSLYYISQGQNNNLAIIGALKLYLDFINLFMYLLRFVGNRKN